MTTQENEVFPFTHGFHKKMTAKWILWSCFLLLLIVLSGLFAFGFLLDKCSSGLVISIVGVCITFLFALPTPDCESPVARGLEDGTEIQVGKEKIFVGEYNRRISKRVALRKGWAGLGLAYLLVGLGFQLWYQLEDQGGNLSQEGRVMTSFDNTDSGDKRGEEVERGE